MNSDDNFEKRAQGLLSESITHVDSRVRSRLTQARHEAIAVAARGRSRFAWLRAVSLAPTAGAVAAALAVVVILWVARPAQLGVGSDPSVTAFEDVSLLTDSDGLDMLEDADASFYEWAASQT